MHERLIQIHDVTNGRTLLKQRGFTDDADIHPWIMSVRLDYPAEVLLEAVTEDSEYFFVTPA